MFYYQPSDFWFFSIRLSTETTLLKMFDDVLMSTDMLDYSVPVLNDPGYYNNPELS